MSLLAVRGLVNHPKSPRCLQKTVPGFQASALRFNCPRSRHEVRGCDGLRGESCHDFQLGRSSNFCWLMTRKCSKLGLRVCVCRRTLKTHTLPRGPTSCFVSLICRGGGGNSTKRPIAVRDKTSDEHTTQNCIFAVVIVLVIIGRAWKRWCRGGWRVPSGAQHVEQ